MESWAEEGYEEGTRQGIGRGVRDGAFVNVESIGDGKKGYGEEYKMK